MSSQTGSRGGQPQFIVGARGWLHDAWAEAFYPEDLPGDWRLSYYSNEFRGVLVPADYWDWAGAEEVADWVEDVAAPFRFFLEPPAQLTGAADSGARDECLRDFLQRAAPLCEGGNAVLLDARTAAGTSSRSLVGLVEALSNHFSVYLLTGGEDLSPELQALAGRAAVEHGCIAEVGSAQLQPGISWQPPGPLAVLHNPGPAACELRSMREVVQGLLGAGKGRGEAVLLCDGAPPLLDDLRNATTIADLLGV